MMGIASGIIAIVIVFFIGTVGSNFLLHTIKPTWSRKKHILWSSMLPPFGLWLLVTSVILFSGTLAGGDGFEFFIPVITLAIILPFMGALIGIPTSWLILKQMNWKNSSSSVDDIFG